MARRVHIESRALEASPPSSAAEIASTFVRTFGWKPPPTWTEINRDEAIEVISSALMNDLVTDAPRLPFREAEEEARRFIASCDPSAVFFTNGALAETRKGFGRHPITTARSDAGVIAITPHRVTLMWLEDG